MEDEPHNGSLQHPQSLPYHMQHHNHHSRHIQHRHISSVDDGVEEEELDPRIQVELEKLNRATEEINRLELELDDARASFRQVLSDSSQRLNGLAKKLGASVDKARPYYDARMKLKEAHLESQKAALRFERACSMHEAAKEMVQLAEEGYKRREEDLDPTWQEMLNHATMKVNDAERERIESEDNHQSTTLNFKKREEEVQKLQRDLKRAITKSKPYFEMKAKFNQVMEDHKRNVSRLEEDVTSTKALYSEALRNLEAISDDIHRQRLERRQKMQLGIRGAGVGAESPSPPPSLEKGIHIDGSASPQMFMSDGEENVGRGKKRWKEQGIVGFDRPLRNQKSISDDHDIDASSLKSDPLNVVVFRSESPRLQLDDRPSSYGGNEPKLPSVIHADAKCARSQSYRQAVDRGREDDTGISSKGLSRTSEVEAMQSSLSRAQEWVNKSPVPQQMRFIKSKSLIDASSPQVVLSSAVSSKPSFSPSDSDSISVTSDTTRPSTATLSPKQQEDDVNQSTMTTSTSPSRPMPSALSVRLSQTQILPQEQHQHISLPSPQQLQHQEHKQQPSPPTSQQLQHQEHQHFTPDTLLAHNVSDTRSNSNSTNTTAIQIQPHLQCIHSPSPNSAAACMPSNQLHTKSSPRAVSSSITPDRSSPSSNSPSGKSPKLQGLILRVDAAGFMGSSGKSQGFPDSLSTSPSYRRNTLSSANSPYGHHSGDSTPITNTVGVSPQRPVNPDTFHQQQLQSQTVPSTQSSSPSSYTTGITTATTTTATQQTGCGIPLHFGVSQNKIPSASISSTTTTTNIITATPLSMATSNSKSRPLPPLLPSSSRGVFKLPTNPSSDIHHLPSPTRNPTNLSPIPTFQQKISPTPLSPSGDRVSILSGRSDSSRGGHLRPPSDSSDTESIASTGPMLDDDQVELLTLDFSEQSISSNTNNMEDGCFMGDNPSQLQRGNWSRMSLPPRLNCLKDYLDRAQQMGTRSGDASGVELLEGNTCDGHVSGGGDNVDDGVSHSDGKHCEVHREGSQDECRVKIDEMKLNKEAIDIVKQALTVAVVIQEDEIDKKVEVSSEESSVVCDSSGTCRNETGSSMGEEEGGETDVSVSFEIVLDKSEGDGEGSEHEV